MARRLYEWLRRRRAEVDDALTARGLAHTFSLARYRLHRRTEDRIRRFARGDLLDVGSGRSPFTPLLECCGARVTTLDLEDRTGATNFIADVQAMPQVEDASFDTVLCTQVLEHVPRPWQAIGEIARVLRPGGNLVLSVPHLSLIHEPPHDYFRYTHYALTSLVRSAGLREIEIEPTGGLFCFLSHGASLVLMSTLGALPGLRWPVFLVNYLLLVRLMDLVDRWLGFAGLYPCDYVMLARRPATADGGE